MLGHQQNFQQQGNFRNEARSDNRFQQSQEPFARSEDAFRFGKLQQQSRNNLRQGDAKYTVFYFGIPTHVSPASVATHFPNASSHFPSSQLITAQVPIEREEAMRFDVLHARRAAIAPYENARHEAATFRRNDLIRRELMSQQRAELKRLEKAQMARERKSHSESVNNFGIPTHVSIAGIASHFPYASSHFPMAGQSKVPIAFEQTHRFDGLAARREALAAREAERMDDAAERREAILVHRQSRLQDKDRMRQEGVERAKARRAKLFADAMVAQRQMLSQQQQQQQLLPAPALVVAESDRNINQSRDITPSSLASEKSMPMEPIDNKSFFVSFALPETVVLADIERHFPRAAAAMHEFESEDCKKAQRDTRMPIPREAEEAHRFELVPVRRAAIISRDKKRMDAGQMRATDSTETRRFVAQNENLMRSRRVSNKDNAGWVEKVVVTTETVKDVKEHGTWSNVAKHDHTTVYVDQKIATHVDSKAFDADTNDRNLQQHTNSTAAPMGLAPTTRPAASTHHQHDVAHMNQRENSETVVHATRDEAGKPLIDERDLAAAAQHNPHQSELTVISINNTSPAVNSAAAVNHDDNKSNDSNLPPVHNQGAPKETKVKPKKFCC